MRIGRAVEKNALMVVAQLYGWQPVFLGVFCNLSPEGLSRRGNFLAN